MFVPSESADGSQIIEINTKLITESELITYPATFKQIINVEVNRGFSDKLLDRILTILLIISTVFLIGKNVYDTKKTKRDLDAEIVEKINENDNTSNETE